jgi:hypothetical protein
MDICNLHFDHSRVCPRVLGVMEVSYVYFLFFKGHMEPPFTLPRALCLCAINNHARVC